VTVLSDEAALVFILAESAVKGRLTLGRIERGPEGMLNVFDAHGNRIDYVSGSRLRSWCLVDGKGNPIDGWREILPEDLSRIF